MPLREDIAQVLGLSAPELPSEIQYTVIDSVQEDGYTRQLIEYPSAGDVVRAFLLLPGVLDRNPASLIHHQHNREHH